MPIARSIVFPGRGRWLSSPGSFALVNFFPFYQEPPEDQNPEVSGSHFVPTVGTAVGYMHYLMESGYDESEEQVYSAEEQRFVRKVLEMIPGGALVINQPHDGSAFCLRARWA